MINSLINNIVENNINQLFSINQYNKLKIHFSVFLSLEYSASFKIVYPFLISSAALVDSRMAKSASYFTRVFLLLPAILLRKIILALSVF